MLKKGGFRAIIFSINCFIAVMLALFIAFRLNFTNPWWAMIMVYLTSQPLSGTLRAKAVYRLLGTLIGGIAMLVIIPNLVDAPELTAAAVILWVALCVYVSVLDRTPRAYAFAVAGSGPGADARHRARAAPDRSRCNRARDPEHGLAL
jgi:uncharacterized membrane protein YccC